MKLKDYKITTLNIPAIEEATGAKWMLLPFIVGFSATTDAAPLIAAPSKYPPGDYYLIPVAAIAEIDMYAEIEDGQDDFDVIDVGSKTGGTPF